MDAWHSLAAASVAAGRARAHLQGKPVQRYPRVGGRSGMEIHRARMELSLIAQEAPTAQRIRMMKHLMAAGLAGPSRAGWEDARHAINCRDLIVQREDLLAAARRLSWARVSSGRLRWPSRHSSASSPEPGWGQLLPSSAAPSAHQHM